MKTLEYKTGEMVIGRGDYVYKKAIESFENSNYIGIVTYNISTKESSTELLHALKVACTRGARVTLITNIPKRFPGYFSKWYADSAKNVIDKYLELLKPENFGPKMSVFFHFKNHAKIIVTDSLVYFGSGNYSDESKGNIECGTISTDINLINYVKNTIIPKISEKSLPYYDFEYNVVSAIFSLREILLFCEEYREKIFEAAFLPRCEYEEDVKKLWVYDSENTGITIEMLQRFIDDFEKFEDALRIIWTIVEEAEEENDEISELRTIYKAYVDSYKQMRDQIDWFVEDTTPMASYNPDTEACRILTEKYGMESFDEDLDFYMDLAMNESQEEYSGLVASAGPTIQEILQELDSMYDYFQQMLKALEKFLWVNKKIDNTKENII